jgi:hypothetical protein
MNADGNTRVLRRYIALDIHKHYCVIASVDREGQVGLQAVRVEHADLEGCLYAKTNQQKKARIMQPPDRFLFLLLFFPLFLLTS